MNLIKCFIKGLIRSIYFLCICFPILVILGMFAITLGAVCYIGGDVSVFNKIDKMMSWVANSHLYIFAS